MWFTVDFDSKTYEILMSHNPEAAQDYLKKRQDYLASLPSVTDEKTVEVVTIEEPKEEKVEEVSEEVDQELIDLQNKYIELTGKNISPAYKKNKEWLASKIAEFTPAEAAEEEAKPE